VRVCVSGSQFLKQQGMFARRWSLMRRHGEQGESLVPPHTRRRISLSLFLSDEAASIHEGGRVGGRADADHGVARDEAGQLLLPPPRRARGPLRQHHVPQVRRGAGPDGICRHYFWHNRQIENSQHMPGILGIFEEIFGIIGHNWA